MSQTGLMYYTYVLYREKDERWYTGTTRDLRARYAAHTNGRVWATRSRRPLSLVYYEACRCQEDAFRRERYLKSGRGKRYLRQRLDVELMRLSCNKLERH
jgi:putative endonuclease